jgi:hypothetical protein
MMLRAALLLATASGCIGAEFVRTESTFVTRRCRKAPAIFLDRLPDRPYASVGIISVGPGASLTYALKVASRKGCDVGCELIVDRSIHHVGRTEPTPAPIGEARFLAAQYTPPYQYPPTYTPSPSPVIVPVETGPQYQFICGIWKGE